MLSNVSIVYMLCALQQTLNPSSSMQKQLTAFPAYIILVGVFLRSGVLHPIYIFIVTGILHISLSTQLPLVLSK
jgi:hypothetical protein